MDCDKPHLTSNEKTQPIQWTKQTTSALVAAGSLWPSWTTQIEGLHSLSMGPPPTH